MTVNTQTNRIDFIADGIQVTFPYNYPVYEAEWMKVYLDGVQQFLGFTVNGAEPGGTNGDVTFDVAPADQVQVTLLRELPFVQLLDYTPFDPFPAETSEAALDEGVMIDIQLSELFSRTSVAPVNDPCADWTITDAVSRRNRFSVYEDTDEACAGVSDFTVTDVQNLVNSDSLKTSINLWLGGKPLDDAQIGGYVFDRFVTFPVGLVNSRAYAEVPANAPAAILLRRNTIDIGSVDFPTGLNVGTFTFTNEVQFIAGDRLTFHAEPTADLLLADIMITLQGDRP